MPSTKTILEQLYNARDDFSKKGLQQIIDNDNKILQNPNVINSKLFKDQLNLMQNLLNGANDISSKANLDQEIIKKVEAEQDRIGEGFEVLKTMENFLNESTPSTPSFYNMSAEIKKDLEEADEMILQAKCETITNLIDTIQKCQDSIEEAEFNEIAKELENEEQIKSDLEKMEEYHGDLTEKKIKTLALDIQISNIEKLISVMRAPKNASSKEKALAEKYLTLTNNLNILLNEKKAELKKLNNQPKNYKDSILKPIQKIVKIKKIEQIGKNTINSICKFARSIHPKINYSKNIVQTLDIDKNIQVIKNMISSKQPIKQITQLATTVSNKISNLTSNSNNLNIQKYWLQVIAKRNQQLGLLMQNNNNQIIAFNKPNNPLKQEKDLIKDKKKPSKK